MAYTIAVSGKGGTGKTTLTGLLIKHLIEEGKGPILAVDADANSNLNEVLGVDVEQTLGEVREVIAHADTDENSPIPPSMSKQDYMEYKMGSVLSEGDDFDMLVMGRTQGKGCYCYVNGLLQTELSKLAKNYEYIVVDNEAGMEYISRGTLPSIDALLLVSDCSRRGIQAVSRINELAHDLGFKPEITKLIVNRAPANRELAPGIQEEIAKHNLDLLGVVPNDEVVYEYDCNGKPTSEMPKDAPSRAAFEEIIKGIF